MALINLIDRNYEISRCAGYIKSKGFQVVYDPRTSLPRLVRRDYVILYRNKGWKVYKVKENLTDTRSESSHSSLMQALKSVS